MMISHCFEGNKLFENAPFEMIGRLYNLVLEIDWHEMLQEESWG